MQRKTIVFRQDAEWPELMTIDYRCDNEGNPYTPADDKFTNNFVAGSSGDAEYHTIYPKSMLQGLPDEYYYRAYQHCDQRGSHTDICIK